jgi:hypothetical protein
VSTVVSTRPVCSRNRPPPWRVCVYVCVCVCVRGCGYVCVYVQQEQAFTCERGVVSFCLLTDIVVFLLTLPFSLLLLLLHFQCSSLLPFLVV